MSFKIGDKVVYNRGSNNHLRMGREYVVRALDEDMDVALDNVTGFWTQDRFVLVPRQQEADREAQAKVEAVHEAAIARQTPIIHCAICHQKAPRVLVKDHPQPGNLLGLSDKVWQNDLDGWMLATFPFRDEYIKDRREGMNNHRFGVTFKEVAKLCPPCATKVREYMAHLAKPMLDDGDL